MAGGAGQAGLRVADVLAFHGRDPQSPSERITVKVLRKALWVAGRPRVLAVALEGASASARLEGGGPVPEPGVARLLGLHLDPGPFEAQVRRDPLLGPLVKARRGLAPV